MPTSEGTGDDRRIGLLCAVQARGYAPDLIATLALRPIAGEDVSAFGWPEPAAAELETLRYELAGLRKAFPTLSAAERKSEVVRIRALAQKYPVVQRSLDQFAAAHKLGRGKASSVEGDEIRAKAAAWLLMPPAQFAAERFAWYDGDIDRNRIALAALKNDDAELFAAVPGFGHYLAPTDPKVEDGELPGWRRRQVQQTKGEVVPLERRERRKVGTYALVGCGLFLLGAIVQQFTGSSKPAPKAPDVTELTLRALNGLNRRPGETDQQYEQRLKAAIQAKNKSATVRP